MDSFVWAMSVMTPSEMMSRMKYCEPSVIADAYLDTRGQAAESGCLHEPAGLHLFRKSRGSYFMMRLIYTFR